MNKIYLIIPLFILLPIFVPEKAFNEEHITNLPLEDIVYVDLETKRIVDTIKQKETGGNCNLKGGSGEFGCMQYTRNTWNSLTKKYYGEIKGYSTTTEEFITYKRIEELRLKNLEPKQIFQLHNQGTYTKPCIRGVNKYGVKFDSCAYVKDAMRIYNNYEN